MAFSYTTIREDTIHSTLKLITRGYDAGRGVVVNIHTEITVPDTGGNLIRGEGAGTTIFIPGETVATLTTAFASAYTDIATLTIADGTDPMEMVVRTKNLTYGTILLKQLQFEHVQRNAPLDIYGLDAQYIDGVQESSLDLINQRKAIEPWWEWNGTNTDQFDSAVEGANVTSSTLTTAARGAYTWLSASTSGTGGSIASSGAFWAISDTPPSEDYLIIADVINQGAISNFAGAVVGVRFTSVSNAYLALWKDPTAAASIGFGQFTATAVYTENGTQNGPVISGTGKGTLLGCGAEGYVDVSSYGYCASRMSLHQTAGNNSTGSAFIGTSIGAGTGTCTNYFRNVRCYDIGAINDVFK